MPVTNKIILGTVQFGLDYGINNSSGKPDSATIKSILDLAFENNIRLLDTAEAYGNSQELIGEYHKTSTNRFDIITKFSAKRTNLSTNLIERISQNLSTLQVNSLYGYMFHSFADFEYYYLNFKDQLIQLKNSGVIKRIGVSIYTNPEFEKLLNYPDVDLVQLPFNLLDNNSKRLALITKANENGIEVHTRSVFLQGLFFRSLDTFPEKLSPLSSYLKEIQKISSNANIQVKELALNYALQQSKIDGVLIGIETVGQLQDNLKSIQTKLPEKVVERIDQLHVIETDLLNPSNW